MLPIVVGIGGVVAREYLGPEKETVDDSYGAFVVTGRLGGDGYLLKLTANSAFVRGDANYDSEVDISDGFQRRRPSESA